MLTVTPDTPLQQAVQMMSDHHVSGLPVVNTDGRLIGELTEQDLMVRESGVTGIDFSLQRLNLKSSLEEWSDE